MKTILLLLSSYRLVAAENRTSVEAVYNLMGERMVDEFTVDEGYSVGEYKRMFGQLVAQVDTAEANAAGTGKLQQTPKERRRLRASVWEVKMPGKLEEQISTRAALLGWSKINYHVHMMKSLCQTVFSRNGKEIYLFGPKLLPSGICPIEKIQFTDCSLEAESSERSAKRRDDLLEGQHQDGMNMSIHVINTPDIENVLFLHHSQQQRSKFAESLNKTAVKPSDDQKREERGDSDDAFVTDQDRTASFKRGVKALAKEQKKARGGALRAGGETEDAGLPSAVGTDNPAKE